jgi:hypothetical protein
MKMGLDMYAFATERHPNAPVDFEPTDADREIHYWRKHPNLHGWMERLYREKGGSAESFNCVAVKLEAQDLDELEKDIRERRLPDTSGFFFGATDGSETEDDLEFVEKARGAIEDGMTVYYSSWW